jgi:hypothetical protein
MSPAHGASLRPRLVVFAVLVLASVNASDAFATQPLILPHASLRPGHEAGLEVAAPRGTTACWLSIRNAKQVVMRHGVTLGGPTRIIRWRVGRSARGTWHVAFSCVNDHAHRAILHTTRTTIVVTHSGFARGRIALTGSEKVGRGSIPEMPSAASPRISNPLGGNDVLVNRCASGNVVGCFNLCSNSEEINSTRTTGDGVGTAVQVEPTGAARRNALKDLLTSFLNGARSEGFPLYRTMWSDLNRCANLPANLSPSQLHSLYEQMACHALYGVSSAFGGNTWDFEAWRNDVEWAEALSVHGRCGQGYGDVPAAGQFLKGALVKSFDTHASTLAPQAWLVDDLNGLVRRNVSSTRGYQCLIAGGKAAARWFPSSFLNEYLAAKGPDISDHEACGSPGSVTGGGGPGNSAPSSSAAAPASGSQSPPAATSPSSPAPGTEYVADDSNAFSPTGGPWTGVSGGGAVGGSYRYFENFCPGDTLHASGTWSMSGLPNGVYDVYAYVPDNAPSKSGTPGNALPYGAHYRVHYREGATDVRSDQFGHLGQWIYLAHLGFSGPASVDIFEDDVQDRAAQNGYCYRKWIVVDAVKWVYRGQG